MIKFVQLAVAGSEDGDSLYALDVMGRVFVLSATGWCRVTGDDNRDGDTFEPVSVDGGNLEDDD